jgi:prophage regulatory protein
MDTNDSVHGHHPNRLLRLPEVLRRFPISKSGWWLGIKQGRFPRPVKLGSRSVAWSEKEVDALIARCQGERHV